MSDEIMSRLSEQMVRLQQCLAKSKALLNEKQRDEELDGPDSTDNSTCWESGNSPES